MQKQMMKIIVLFLALFVQTIVSDYEAIAYITSRSGYNVSGSITFYQDSETDEVTVSVNLTGFDDYQDEVAIHVHEYGDLTADDGTSAGSHYVGQGSDEHNCPPNSTRHEGDMGSWTVTNNEISQSQSFDLLTLSGDYSVLGRAVVVHNYSDSCDGSSGNAGNRIAYGVIGIANKDTSSNNTASNITTLVTVLSSTTNCPIDSCDGYAWFQYGDDGYISVYANFPYMESGARGFHIHAYGDITEEDGNRLGSHYNPDGADHNLPPAEPRHQGDLGNLDVFDNSTNSTGGWYYYSTAYITSFNDLIGRGVALHVAQDYGNGTECDSAGNSGYKIAIGVIGIQGENYSYSTYPDVPDALIFPSGWDSEDCAVGTNAANVPWGWFALVVACLVFGLVLFTFFYTSKPEEVPTEPGYTLI